MKRTRLLILVSVLVAALFIAVLPTLAFDPAFASWPNWSFEFDSNGDGVPNHWNFNNGDIVYICDHPTAQTYDDCFIGFLPSDSRAMVWQHISQPAVNLEEGQTVCVMSGNFAAKRLPASRVYGGGRIHWDTGESATIYGLAPGGNYNFNNIVIWDTLSDPDLLGLDGPDYATWGFLARPGDGYFFVDFAHFGCPG